MHGVNLWLHVLWCVQCALWYKLFRGSSQVLRSTCWNWKRYPQTQMDSCRTRRLLDAAMRAVVVVYWYHQYYSASLITRLRSCTSCWVKDQGSDKILARLQSSISLSATLSMNGCKQARISSDDLIWRKKCDYVGLEVNQDSPRWKKAPSLTVLQSAKLGGAGKVGSMHDPWSSEQNICVCSWHDYVSWAHTHIGVYSNYLMIY